MASQSDKRIILAFLFPLLLQLKVSSSSSIDVHPPTTGNDWISLNEGVEFQPGSSKDPSKSHSLRLAQERFLEESSYSGSEQQLPFLDSQETYYDSYATAWRYVGFFTDCNSYEGDDDDRRAQRHREMNQDDEEGACARYLLWALYANLDYRGLGIGEYQFFDTYTEEWDTSACELTGTENCTKMDCHLPDTKWELLGYFKEKGYSDWFEQLFKHEGYCVWQEGEYEFMYENYGSWPQCTETAYYSNEDEAQLYYGLKVVENATMTIGLFTDSRCSKDYMGDEVSAESLVLNGNGNKDDGNFLTEENIEYWNNAMEIYRVCQPCRAYALNEGYPGGNYNYNNRRLNNNRKLDDYDPNYGKWQCNDIAGYTNVNQCMKFRTKTNMEYANFNEVWMAAQQGSVTSLSVDGRMYGKFRSGYTYLDEQEDLNLTYFWTSLGVLIAGMISLIGALVWRCSRRVNASSLREPLVHSAS